MKFPSAFREHFFPQPVTVPGCAAGMISVAVALDSESEQTRVVWMFYAQVDEVTGDSNLPLGLKPCPAKDGFNLNLKRRVALFAAHFSPFDENAALGVFKKQVKVADSLPP